MKRVTRRKEQRGITLTCSLLPSTFSHFYIVSFGKMVHLKIIFSQNRSCSSQLRIDHIFFSFNQRLHRSRVFFHTMPPGGNVLLCSSDVKLKITVAPLIILTYFYLFEASLCTALVNSPCAKSRVCINLIMTCNFEWLCEQLQQPRQQPRQYAVTCLNKPPFIASKGLSAALEVLYYGILVAA